MRFLGISFIVIILLTSCTVASTKDFVVVENTVEKYKNPYFADSSKDYVYKANFEVYGRTFGGLLIIKKLATEHHRIVFATEFGSKMMDMELINDVFTINFIADDLNKKIVINTLKKDFKILLQEEIRFDKTYQNTEATIFQLVDNKRFNYYYVSKKNQQLVRILHASKSKEKIIFNFESKDGKMAENIIIDHKNIKLKIKLKRID
ncbi:hypothetical protein JBL43_02475 [Aureibaculum sp. A20]|uniref:DUF4292 domain-containing protein n=1 Tax=Aureibaculum flavum TaxID=2795986 RepID=A0ABS0WMA6_9FLAO|nr:hypothetical protein [Aureibaculum flavum]MBJ2173086.1 hypothetical protein [Aureibaculum flavum]